MVEYAAVLNIDFAELLSGGLHDISNWLKGVPFYWYAIAIVIFFIFVRLLTRRGSSTR
jgi:hypothetical protein